jgi:SAM-dependent methyltransferase
LSDSPADLKDRLLDASRSFRKKEGRHELRTADVFYCSFRTPNFSVSRGESQRDAATRLARFGLTPGDLAGKRVLDLGANVGAMLFELSNHGPAFGLGIEYDAEKVALAQEIAALSGLTSLSFVQGDIDRLDAGDLGAFDIVLALAIEAHVLDADRLYRLLGEVTLDMLCFEGNGGCDVDLVRSKLGEAGFPSVEYLGFCDDDIVPRNNRRPVLVARKTGLPRSDQQALG